MLDEAFRNLRLGLIPPKLDQVLVGAADRCASRTALFCLGWSTGSSGGAPRRCVADGRGRAARRLGLTLGDTSRGRMDVSSSTATSP